MSIDSAREDVHDQKHRTSWSQRGHRCKSFLCLEETNLVLKLNVSDNQPGLFDVSKQG